jgi:hypothetical protein
MGYFMLDEYCDPCMFDVLGPTASVKAKRARLRPQGLR